jgi:hypothetical protein
MSGGSAHDRKRLEDAVEREVQRRLDRTAPSFSQQDSRPQKPTPSKSTKSVASPGLGFQSLLVWVRAAGVASVLFGVGSVMLAGWFWVGVGLIYAGLLLMAVDLWLEPSLS